MLIASTLSQSGSAYISHAHRATLFRYSGSHHATRMRNVADTIAISAPSPGRRGTGAVSWGHWCSLGLGCPDRLQLGVALVQSQLPVVAGGHHVAHRAAFERRYRTR